MGPGAWICLPERTRKMLNWEPTRPGVIEDLTNVKYL